MRGSFEKKWLVPFQYFNWQAHFCSPFSCQDMTSNENFKWVLNYFRNPWNQWATGTKMYTFTERNILLELPLSNVILNMLNSLSLVLNNLHYKCGMLLIPSYSTRKQSWNYLRTKLISIIYWINLFKTTVLCPCLTTACNLFECFAASNSTSAFFVLSIIWQ